MDLIFCIGVFLVSIKDIHCIDGRQAELSRFNFFDIDLLKYAAEDREGNVMVSPASIKSTLAMLLEGAGGITETELRSALRLSPFKDEFREQLNTYLSLLQVNTPGVKISNANGVFVSKKLKLHKHFVSTLSKLYFADIQEIDFSNPFNASDIINRWVGQNTKGLITDIIQPAQLSPKSEMIIANALYFKGLWARGFNPRYTRSGCFHRQGSCLNVAMMELHSELNYAYVDNLRAHALELQYQGGEYSMILLVPLDFEGCAQLVRDLPYMSLPQISILLEPTDIRLIMPKFTVEFNDNVAGPLRNMRVVSLFTKNANLSGMYEGGAPQVDSIIHRVHMTVDEQGTVAAAASSAMVIPLIGAEVQLRVDRPFVFFIRNNKLGQVLFEGKIDEPNIVEDIVPTQSKTKPSNERRYSNKFF
ncbi:leukocyte elastase inhibitor-like [Leptidea sinapis]|uniref:leukocyte elastase inhibitor-like n=1 Tax=Leptidea sinapis TaxID=189913 RepID=UPI002127C8EA|nr:leukocyte elastase inhibitor-like [Leptidea sinapis]